MWRIRRLSGVLKAACQVIPGVLCVWEVPGCTLACVIGVVLVWPLSWDCGGGYVVLV